MTTALSSAITSADRELSYRELETATARRAAEFLATVAPGTLLHLPFQPRIEAVVSYLAALSAGLPLLITGQVDPAVDSGYGEIIRTYQPAATIDPDTGELVRLHHAETAEPIHPDIAVLLATSGSTGSKKLVKLSLGNLIANARAIAHGLGITAADRGITLLPLHYSFGLSVLNSHLISGASIAVEECSVAAPGFAEQVERCGVTNIGVVPHMLQVLRTADGGQSLAQARLVYQAGGKLDPADVTHWHRFFADHGTDFRVMYGQTEATARMTIMPAELMADHPNAVGTPLAGHHMRVTGTGELVFTGPSVMLGYAESPEDLRVGRTITELRTGDLGEIVTTDGGVPLVRITGRASDFVKLAGVRTSCEQIRLWLAERGITACVTGDDTALRIAADVQTSRARLSAPTIERDICQLTGLTPAFVRVVVLPAFPLLDNGKIDRRHCAALADAAAEIPEQARYGGGQRKGRNRAAGEQVGAEQAVIAQIARALGVASDAVRRDLSFVDNGGSSLSFVPVAMAFADAGIELPTGWHDVPIDALLARPSDRPLSLGWLDAPIVLRAICAITIVLTHASSHKIMGGAHSLLVIAGVMLGSFGLSIPSARTRLRATARSLAAVAIPTIAVVLVGMAITGRYGLANLLFIHWWKPSLGGSGSLWFIESYLLGMLLIAGFFAIPQVYRLYQRQPFWTAALLTAVLLAWRFKTGAWDIMQTRFEPPGVIWFIAAGIMIANARTTRHKLITAAMLVGGSISLFEHTSQWIYVMIVCAVLLLGVRLPVPRIAVKPVGLIASASLYIYLIQFDILDQPITEVITVPLSLLAGIALWWVTTVVVAELAGGRFTVRDGKWSRLRGAAAPMA